MPLTKEQKIKMLLDAGLDPAEYVVDEFSSAPPPKSVTAESSGRVPVGSGEALGRGAVSNLAPTVAGAFPGMAAGARVPGPWPVKALGSVAGGIIGHEAVAKLQDTALNSILGPEGNVAYQERNAEARRDHPRLFQLGEFASNLLGFNPMSIPAMGRGLKTLLVGARPDIAAKEAMIQTGINMGVSGGADAIGQAVGDSPFDPTQTALATILGGAAARPNKYMGNFFFPHPARPEPPKLPESTSKQVPTPEVVKSFPEKTLTDEFAADEALKAREQAKPEPIVGDRKLVAEDRDPNFEYPVYDADGNVIKEKLEIKDGKVVKKPTPEDDITPDPTEMWYQEDGVTLKPGLTEEQITYAKNLATKRGQNFEVVESLKDHETGEPVRGRYLRPERLVTINKPLATADTGPHESGGHGFVEDLLGSSLKGDRTVAERGIAAAGSKENLAEAIGKRIVDIENAPLRSWVEDFWSNSKRLVRLGHAEDRVNHLARRARDDRPYSESPELHGGSKDGEPLYSDEGTKHSVPFLAMGNEPVMSFRGPSKTTDRDLTWYRDMVDEEAVRRGKLYVKNGPGYDKDGNRLYQAEDAGSTPSAKKEPSSSFLTFMKSVIDSIKDKSSKETYQKAAAASQEYETTHTRQYGDKVNKSDEITRPLKGTPEEARWVWENRMMQGKTSAKISPEAEAALRGPIRDLYVRTHDEQRKLGIKVNGRDAKDDPNAFPLIISKETLDTFRTKPDGVEANKLRKDWIEHKLKFDKDIKTEAEATASMNDYLRGLAQGTKPNSPEYNALIKAQGSGIPYSWMEKDVRKLFHRYYDNVAQHFSYHKAVLSKPDVAAIFGVEPRGGPRPKDASTTEPPIDENIQVMGRRMAGDYGTRSAKWSALEHLVRGIIMGPGTAIRNFTSTFAQVLPYISVKDLPKLIEAFIYIKQGLRDSMDMGVNRWNITGLEAGQYGGSAWADKVKSLGDLMRTIQGSNWIERMSRAHTMALGELVTQASWARAAKGDVRAAEFLRKFGLEKENFKTDAPTPEKIKEVAANFTERVQGSYGPKGLPAFMLEPTTPFYWMMSLSKWSVEKANVVKQDVINPVYKGDWGPLLRYASGGLLTGAAILEINELLNNRKSQTPNIVEIADSGKSSDYTYKAIEAASLAGLGGIVMDAFRMGADVSKGNSARDINNPSVGIVEDVMGGFADVIEAINDGADPVLTVLSWVRDVTVQNTQALKIASNQINSEDLKRKDDYRDLRVYKQLKDQPVSRSGAVDVNPYLQETEKRYKRAKTTEEAVKILKEEILPKLKELDPDTRKKYIAGLKRNSYQTVPSDRREAQEYAKYLARTQGEESSAARIQDKRQQDLLNRQKARMVPSR